MKQRATERIINWRHTFRVYFAWVRMRWLLHLAYRFNVVFNSFSSLAWVAVTLIMYRLLFNQIEVLAGWSWEQMLILYGVYNFWWGLMVAFFNGGLGIGQKIRRGGLDKLLLWPGKTIFYATMKFEPELLLHSLTGAGILLIACREAAIQLPFSTLIFFSILLFHSFVLIFFIAILFGTTSFWVMENKQITDLFWLVETLSKYPREFFSGNKILYWLIYTALPVVFIAVVPTQVILGTIRWPLVISAPLITIIFGLITKRVWGIGLKRYTGVSV